MKKVKTRKIYKFKYSDENDYVDYNDNVCEDIGKVRELKIGQEDEENEDRWGRCLKLKIIVKMRKRDSYKDNNDVDYTVMMSVKTYEEFGHKTR